MSTLNNILLVDDDDISNYLSKRVLEKIAPEASVVVLHNGKEAFDLLKDKVNEGNSLPQLLIIDHNMPIMNGIELMKNLSRIKPGIDQQLLAILLSTHITKKQQEIFHQAGVKEFLPKPLTEKEMKLLIDKYFNILK